MANQRLNWGVLILGLLFVLNPLYWDFLVNVGVAPLLDWLGAISVIPGGTYYLGIGGMYFFAGILALRHADRQNADLRQLSLGVGASLLVVWTGLVIFWWSTVGGIGVMVVAFSLGTGPVLIGLLIGASSDRSTTRVLWAIAILLALPFVGWYVAQSMSRGGPSTFAGFFTLLSAALLVVLDVIWGYPLYRLGRSLA